MQTKIFFGLHSSLQVGRLMEDAKTEREMILIAKRNNCGKAVVIKRHSLDMATEYRQNSI